MPDVLLCAQFPLADIRPFALGETRSVGVPSSYVRRAGVELDRLAGGVVEWPAENEFWSAMHTLRFADRLDRRTFGDWERAGFGGAFRRFFWDGSFLPRSRVELGITNTGGGRDRRRVTKDSARDFDARQVKRLLNDFLSMPVRISRRGQLAEHPLHDAAGAIAQLMLASTTRWRDAPELFRPQPWWVRSGQPMCFVEYGFSERGELPAAAKLIDSPEGFTLHFMHLAVDGRVWPVWFLRIDGEPRAPEVRLMRLYLMRLHAEAETLRAVLELLADPRQAELEPSGPRSRLDVYLVKALGLLSRRAHYGQDTPALLEAAYGYREGQTKPERTRIEALADQVKVLRPNLAALLEQQRKALAVLAATEGPPSPRRTFPPID